MKTIIRIFVLSMLLLSSLVVTAQDELVNTYRSPDDSFAFNYPQDWFVSEPSDEGDIRLGSTEAALAEDDPHDDNVLLTFYPPAVAADLEADTPVDLLAAYLETLDLPTDTIADLSIADREAATVEDDTADDLHQMFVAVRFSDETVGLVVVSTQAELADYMDTLLAILATFDNYDEAIHGAATLATCVVRVDKAGVAALRVGPGTNRTELSSLPPDQEVTVLGKAEADDGSLWWQLDKQEALPKSAADEIWVAQNQVVASGACDRIGDADAPPIVPISSGDAAIDDAASEVSSTTGIAVQITVPRGNGLLITRQSQTNFEAMAYIPTVGRENGAGIWDVQFEIRDAKGSLLDTQSESIVRYCAFGGDTVCDSMSSGLYNSLTDGRYSLRVRARNKATGDYSDWVTRTFCIGSC